MIKRLFVFSTLAVTVGLLSAPPAAVGLELPTPTYTGVVVAIGDDYVVLDTDFNGRRLVVVDPDTVLVEPVLPLTRQRVEFRMSESNLPHARLVEPAPTPPLLPVPSERVRAPAPERPGQVARAPSRSDSSELPWVVVTAAALAPLMSLALLRRG